MKNQTIAALLTACWTAGAISHVVAAESSSLQIDDNDIGGVVRSASGPEAGVWVIAETNGLKSEFAKIVVTDELGRYVLPDLPKAKYDVWVRGYGLVDSKPVDAKTGIRLDLTVAKAPTPAAAAEIYPANYWYALLRPPAAEEFPGTGPKGNGIAPAMKTQQDWIGYIKEECIVCHLLGDKWTRTLATSGSSVEAWEHRLMTGTGTVADPRMDELVKTQRGRMINTVTRLGGQRALAMFADWTDRIGAGELPPSPPPRPTGVERNVVLSLWGWSITADGVSAAVHDEIASDKRNPTTNGNGRVYGTQLRYGRLATLDPVTHESATIDIPGLQAPHRLANMPHNPMVDQKGRVWATMVSGEGTPPAYCIDGTTNKYAAYYPSKLPVGRQIAVYDPTSGKTDLIPVCFNVHHLNFGLDKDDTLYFSGDSNVMGWLKTRVWDETHDAQKAMGWCPMVLDTNGDGKITPDRTQWNEPANASFGATEEDAGANKVVRQEAAFDPKRDTRHSGSLYGLNVSPADGSVWYAEWRPLVPTGIVRLEPGGDAPATCKTEYYEPPKRPDGTYAAFNGRGVDLDANGVAWVAFGSGQLGSFDRRKCKTVNGPGSLGQQCPEGWSFFDMPGPKVTGVKEGSADWPYLVWVDLHNIFGLGKNIPILPGNNSDALLAFMPESRTWVTLRVPYPMGFFPRGLDGRIDDAKTGWKGRGLWANFGMAQNANLHTENSTPGRLVKLQLRPTPLAH